MRTRNAKAKLIAVDIVLVAAIFAMLVALALGITQCTDDAHARHYGGSEHTVAAHVDTANRYFTRFWSYNVDLTTEEKLPDGSHHYESGSRADWEKLDGLEGQDVFVTFGADGYIKEVSE